MMMMMRMRMSSRLCLLVAATTGGVLLSSSPAPASVPAEPIGIERLEPSRERRAKRSRPMDLAAKKKKKRKSSGKHPAGAVPVEEEGDDKTGGDEAAAPGGASNEELQKAARVAPKETGGSETGDEAGKPKRGAIKVEEKSTATPSGPPTSRFLDVSVGGHGFLRSLSYNQYRSGDVREYQPKLLGAAAAAIQYYPAAQFTNGFVTNLGLDLNVEQAFGVSSRAVDGTTFATQVHDYNGGVRLRIPLDGIEPSLIVGYGDHAFKVTGGANRPPLPNTDYKYVRAVAGLRVALASNLSLMASGGYRHVLSPGEIKTTFFPNLKVAGVEASAGVGYAFNSSVEARAGVDLRRYFYTFHAKNGDPYIVGGAVDQTIAFSLSVAVMLGGSDQPHAATEEASPSGGDADADKPAKRKKSKRPKMEDGATGME